MIWPRSGWQTGSRCHAAVGGPIGMLARRAQTPGAKTPSRTERGRRMATIHPSLLSALGPRQGVLGHAKHRNPSLAEAANT